MDVRELLWWIVLLPLAGSLVCAFLHALSLRGQLQNAPASHAGAHDDHGQHHDHSQNRGLAGLAPWVACGAMAAAFALSVLGFLQLRDLEQAERALHSPTWRWLTLGDLRVDFGLLLDPLSSTMTLVITGVGFLIHVYSAGYMHADRGYAKFFAYLNLFVAAMLMLVLSTSLIGLFVGWEGVGLCSYLLIGFWYAKGWPAQAAQKAFITNRVGDAFFLAGSFLLFDAFGSLDLSVIAGGAALQAQDSLAAGGSGASSQLALAALCLFLGCCGKSAQLPLFTWLPDAMAGPTPVSALIHAATMVTSGLYLVTRLNPLFAASPWVMTTMACVGALTALIGASSALVQRDIKRVLAYSTVSQLGYMFLALGAGSFGSAIFHVVTHAFFKALLFLGAGSVIHGMHEEQDLYKMGGLRRAMPRTYVTFLAGAAALSGLPLLSGFFSKDEILARTFAVGGWYWLLWVIGIGAAAMTAFYSWRMVALTFFGTPRYDSQHVHAHESGALMTTPLMVLAFLSIVGGLLGLPEVFHVPHVLEGWLGEILRPGKQILAAQHGGDLPHLSHAGEWSLLLLSSAVALVFAHLGFHAFKSGPAAEEQARRRAPQLHTFLGNAWGIDAGYGRWIVGPIRLVAFVISVVIDAFAIDGLVNGSAALVREIARNSRRLATGRLASYALWIVAGATAISFVWMIA